MAKRGKLGEQVRLGARAASNSAYPVHRRPSRSVLIAMEIEIGKFTG